MSSKNSSEELHQTHQVLAYFTLWALAATILLMGATGYIWHAHKNYKSLESFSIELMQQRDQARLEADKLAGRFITSSGSYKTTLKPAQEAHHER